MSAAVLMLQGTMSDAGKSVLTAALCRLLHRQGIRVAPFKPQNMALNSAVTLDGGEIGRAQALQAAACGLQPHTDMNPILLKPNSDRTSQVILQGRAIGNMNARQYHEFKPQLHKPLLESFHRLAANHQVIIVEGAGSPAEINLRERDIANMGFAELVDCPVVLIGDIDRGGVFAQMVGTLHLLTPQERGRVKGLLINKFRGDLSLLTPGLQWLEKESGKPVLGVVPFVPGLCLEAEDSFFDRHGGQKEQEGLLRVVVPRFPRLSNHTDLDPLIHHPLVDVRIIEQGEGIPAADLILLPGSKNVRQDMQWMEEQGWRQAILRHLRYGGKILGICGGFQMLGERIKDPLGQEGPPGACAGLGVLAMETEITAHKHLCHNQGTLAWNGAPVSGYEIHMGVSTGAALHDPAMILQEGPHGALSADGQIMGCYLHGLLDQPEACQSLLTWVGMQGSTVLDIRAQREASLERLADTLASTLDGKALATLLPGVL